MAIVSFDPQSRKTLHNRRVYADKRPCDECKKPVDRLFTYHTETEDGKDQKYSGYFCKTSCFKKHHGFPLPAGKTGARL